MKINHEMPLEIMEWGREYIDYDFALPHLFDEDKSGKYLEYFAKSKQLRRTIIMDNSIHELGEAYPENELWRHIVVLLPNEFIVPDVFNDSAETLSKAKYWINKFKESKLIDYVTPVAVLHAESYGRAVSNYNILKDLGYKKIAFPYISDYYEGDKSPYLGVSEKSWGRNNVIKTMIREGVIEENDRIHLLGTYSPREFSLYKDIKQIETIDTSNPVMAGLEEKRYNEYGLFDKPKLNLNSNFFKEVTPSQQACIQYNIRKFKEINENN